MKRPTVRLALSLLVVVLLTGVGLHEPAAQDVGEIKLGAFAPISGATADVGAQIKAGAEVAVERFNEQAVRLGGKRYRVRLMWYDTEGKGDVGLMERRRRGDRPPAGRALRAPG